MNDKPQIAKTSIDDVAKQAKVAIGDVADKAMHATEKLAGATHDAVTTIRQKVEQGGAVASRKIKRAATKLETATRDLGRKV